MLAALPPIAGNTPISTPMNERPQQQEGPRQDFPDHLEMRYREAERAVHGVTELGDAAHALDFGHDLREGEHADQHRQEIDAALEHRDAEREALLAHHRVVAEDGDDQPEAARDQALGERRFDQPRDHRQREHEQREEFPGAELERELRQRSGREDQERAAEQAAEERGPDAEPDRASRLAFLRHRMAVEGGGDRRGRAGDAEQHRGRPVRRPSRRRRRRSSPPGPAADRGRR